MKKFFGFGKGKKKGLSPSPSDTSSVLSAGYQLQDKDLDKLHRAAYSGDVSKIRQLLRKQDVNHQDNANRTPLHLACANGQSDVVSLLVENHARVNLCDSENRSPLMKAIQCQQESCAAILLGYNADPNVVDFNGNAALHFAARIPSISIASQLLEHGADIDALNKDGCTPLMLAIIENNEEMVEFLIKEGSNINAKDANERTSLMIAASNGHISLVKTLLDHEADISIQDEKGWSADDHAVMHGHHASRKKSSEAFHGAAKKRGTSGLSNQNKDVDGIFTLGSPAIDKEELQLIPKQTSTARAAGKVTDDFSQAESESRASQKSAAADSWPSSDDDFDLSPQKAPKPNLKKLFHTKASGKGTSKLHSSLSKARQQNCLSSWSTSKFEKGLACQKENEGGQESDQSKEGSVCEQAEGASENLEDEESENKEAISDEEEQADSEEGLEAVSGEEEEEADSEEASEAVSGEEEEADSGEQEEVDSSEQKEADSDEEYGNSAKDVEVVSEDGQSVAGEGRLQDVLGKENKCENDAKCGDEQGNGECDDENGRESEQCACKEEQTREDKLVTDQEATDNASLASASNKHSEDNDEVACSAKEITEDVCHGNEYSSLPYQGTQATPDGNDVPVSLIIGFYELPDENTASGLGSDITSQDQATHNMTAHSNLCSGTRVVNDLDSKSSKEAIKPTQSVHELQSSGGFGGQRQNEPSDDEVDGNEGSDFKEHPQEASNQASSSNTHVDEKLQGPVGRKETLMSELGLDEDDVESPWDSEASLASPRKPPGMKVTQSSNEELPKKKSPAEIKEPQAVAVLLPTKEISPTSPSIRGSSNVKSDVMADLGLDDADDLEDVSELESTSYSLKFTANAESGRKFSEDPLEAKSRPAAPAPLTITTKASRITPTSKQSDRHDCSEEEDHNRSVLAENVLQSSKKNVPQMESSDEFSEKSSAPDLDETRTVGNLLPARDVLPASPSVCAGERYTKSDFELDDSVIEEDSLKKGVLTQADPNSLAENMLNVANMTVSNKLRSHVNEDVISQRPRDSQLVQNLSSDLVSSSDSEEPWEERYEKMWVENEKKDVKTNFKEVAAELKHKFGEITVTKKKEKILVSDTFAIDNLAMHVAELENAPKSPLPQASVEQDLEIAVCEESQRGMDRTQSNGQNPNSVLIDQVDVALHSSPSVCFGVDTQKTTLDTNHDLKNPVGTVKTDVPKDNLLLPSNSSDFKRHGFSSLQMKNYFQNSFLSTNEGTREDRPPLKSEDVAFGSVQATETGSSATSSNEAVLKHSDLRLPQHNEHDNGQLSQVPPQNPSGSPSSDSKKHGLDKQLEQDMKRFKNEVGMLQSVFLDLVKGNGQHQNEVAHKGKEKNRSLTIQLDSDDSYGDGKGVRRKMAFSNLQNKPKQMAGDGQSKGKERNSSEGSKNTRLSKKSGLGKPHMQQRITPNGKLLDAFDDSTLSETSQEDDGRDGNEYLSGNKEIHDEDEFSQSSDTGSDAFDSPTFRNAMLIIEGLTVDCQGSLNLIKIEDTIRKYERSLQKETGRYALLAEKVKGMENDHKDLQQLAQKNRELMSKLEHQKVEWDSDLNHIRFMLKQEEEKRKSAEMLYEKGRDQLRKKEDQCCKEMEQKQQLEMALRNMEREMRSLSNNVKKSEEDRNEAQRLLSQERNTRALQEDFLNNLRRKNEEEEARIILAKTAEVHTQPSESSEREKDLLQRNRTLQDEISVLKQELDKVQSLNDEEKHQYMDDNEMLKEKVDDLKRDLKMNEETLTQNLIQYNGQLNALRTEATIFCTKLEHEKQAKERLETELESFRSRLSSALQELEKGQTLKTDVERSLQRERDEWMRTKDKLNYDLSNLQENSKNLSQQLSKAEAKCNDLERELHRKGLSLQERVVLLESTQRDLTQAQCRIKELESTLLLEKDQFNKSTIKQESMLERLAQIQSENLQLRQQLDELQSKGIIKDKAVSDVQDRFTDIFSKLRVDTERQVFLVEERNKDLINKSNELREQIYRLETEKVEGESCRRQLQQELADSFKKLSMSEASLEVITRYRNDLEEEKQNLHKELEKSKNKLQDLEEQYIQSERLNHQLKNVLDDKEREIVLAIQKVQEFSTATAAAEKSAKQLEEHVQKLEIENAKIEATAKHQTNQIEILQRELQESISNQNRLEDLVTSLQSSKMGLEEKLNQQAYKQTAVSMNAQESQNKWEEELKSKSRLGIRLAELDREKAELVEQVDRERKKVKKLAEMKKSVESRFDQEVKRSSDLQREVSGIKKLLKTAKKKLKEYESSGYQQSKSDVSTTHKNLETDPEFCRLKDKIEQLSITLERESTKYKQVDSMNRELQDELYSMKLSSKKQERHEKGRRHLEDEVADLKRHLESSKLDHSTMESFKREIEEKGRQELRQKLEEVNLFLQTQAAAQDSLEQIRAANDASLRSQLESRIQDLETELHKIKSAHKESECQKESSQTELDRFKDLYADEMKMRKSIAAKLERTYERLEEANTKLLNERQRSKSLIASSIVNGNLSTSPVLDVSPIGIHGRSLTMNGNFGPGGSFLSSTGNGLTTNRMDSYLAQIQLDLEKSIAKELQQANTDLDTGYTRVPPVGSTAGTVRNPDADIDPVSRTAQQYLEVLKKNYML